MNSSVLFLTQIIITVIFSMLAAIFDIRKNIVPEKICYFLIFFGIISNFILSLVTNDVKYFLASIISMVITYIITYMLWKLDMWAGGDVMLFTSIATVIPSGIFIDFLNISPCLSIYPFSFTVIANSILISFPFLVIFMIHLINERNIFEKPDEFLFNLFSIESLIFLKDSILKKTILVKNLKEGMIIDNYCFNDEYVYELIKESKGNLCVYRDEKNNQFKYYFKSKTSAGITHGDEMLLKIMSAQNFISKEITTKLGFPFAPAIFAGLIISIFFGDLVMIFTKNIILVV